MIKKIIKTSVLFLLLLLLFVFALDFFINKNAKKFIYTKNSNLPKCYTGLVLGARVYDNGELSGVLRDRIDTALDLYKLGKIKRFLLSGDHEQDGYDEANQMKNYLTNKGVPENDIFLDHAGIDTYDSAYRAKNIFMCKYVIIISQEFHLKRAIYIARKLGLEAYGIKADKRSYGIANKMKIREKLANIKAFLELLVNKKSKYLGEQIPIIGDSKLSYD